MQYSSLNNEENVEISSQKPRFLFPQRVHISSTKHFSFFTKKLSRKACNLQFDYGLARNQEHQKIRANFNRLPKVDVHELKLFLKPDNFVEPWSKTMKWFSKSLENLKKFPNLSKLYLDLPSGSWGYSQFPEHLCKILKRLARLKHLCIYLPSKELTGDQILSLMSHLKRLKSLRFLELLLPFAESLIAVTITELCRSLSSLQKLRGLSLDLSDCHHLNNDEHIEKLFENIRILKNISSLSLSLRNLPKLTIKGVYILLSLLNHEQEPDTLDKKQVISAKFRKASPLKLTNLHLDLSSFNKNTPPNRILSHGLTALELDLSSSKNLNIEELMEICFALSYLKHISKLSLNLSGGYNIVDETILSLAHGLRSLCLVDFSLVITNGQRVTPSSWINLFQALRVSTGMKKFVLFLANSFEIDNLVLKELGLCLGGMVKLELLSLMLIECLLDDNCLGETAGFFGNLKNLQSLNLVFEKNPSFSCQGFEKIFTKLNEITHLKKLRLCLDSKCFANNSRELWSWSIESLELQVSGWDEIQFVAFCRNLSQLSKLKSLNLQVKRASNISAMGIIDFKERIKAFRNLNCFGSINTFSELNEFFWINWKIKDILKESNDVILGQYAEKMKSYRQPWSFTLCGVKIW